MNTICDITCDISPFAQSAGAVEYADCTSADLNSLMVRSQ